jgi:uncharacterized membrane protein
LRDAAGHPDVMNPRERGYRFGLQPGRSDGSRAALPATSHRNPGGDNINFARSTGYSGGHKLLEKLRMKSLFDLSFTRFVSPSIAKVVYVLVMIGLGIMYLTFVVSAFASGNSVAGLFVLLVIGPLIVLVYLCLIRMGLESLLASIRTAENTAELVRLQHAELMRASAHRNQGPEYEQS